MSITQPCGVVGGLKTSQFVSLTVRCRRGAPVAVVQHGVGLVVVVDEARRRRRGHGRWRRATGAGEGRAGGRRDERGRQRQRLGWAGAHQASTIVDRRRLNTRIKLYHLNCINLSSTPSRQYTRSIRCHPFSPTNHLLIENHCILF